MENSEIVECFAFVQQLARNCGNVLNEGIKNCGQVTVKDHFYELLTLYDGKIERMLIDGIRDKYPDHKFIAEEDASLTKEEQVLSEAPTWIIDPIDGTINFVHQLKYVCISIALAVNKQLELAILYNPCHDEFFTARRGHGAFLNGVPISASKCKDMKQALLAHEISLATHPMSYHKNIERTKEFIKRCIGIRAFGSAALTLGYVAQGTIDAYNVENLKPWDIAAGALLVQEAGGVVVNKRGGAYDIMKPDIIAAGTTELCQTILQIVTDIDEQLARDGIEQL